MTTRCDPANLVEWDNRIFTDGEDVVIQYQPKKSEYVNRHENCLHLWRPGLEDHIPTPPKELVG